MNYYKSIKKPLREEYSDTEIKNLMGKKFVTELQQLNPAALRKAIEVYRETMGPKWSAIPETITHKYVFNTGGWSLNTFDDIEDAISAVDASNKPAAVLVFLRGKTTEGNGFIRDFEIYTNAASKSAANKEETSRSKADGTLEGAIKSMPAYLKKYYRRLEDKVDEKDLIAYLGSADASNFDLSEEDAYDWKSAEGIEAIIEDIDAFIEIDDAYEEGLEWALNGWAN